MQLLVTFPACANAYIKGSGGAVPVRKADKQEQDRQEEEDALVDEMKRLHQLRQSNAAEDTKEKGKGSES